MAIKLGAENKRNVAILAVLGLVVVAMLVRTILQNFGGSDTAPVTVRPAQTAGGGHEATKVASLNLDPTLHPELMAQTERMAYTGHGRNIFSQESAPVELPQPKVSPRPAPVDTGPPPPPPPPNIDLKFFGFEAPKTGARKVFLLHGEDIFLAAEGDVVDRRYRVGRIQPFSVEVTDLPFNHTQSLPLVQN